MKRVLYGVFALGLVACAAPGGEAGGAGGSPPARAASASLAGTRWVGVIDASLDRRAQPRLEFVSEGRISGFTGCNMMSGTWRREGGEVRFGSIVATKRMCAGAEGEVEKRFLAVLGAETRARMEGDRLVLSGPGGARFEFVRAGS